MSPSVATTSSGWSTCPNCGGLNPPGTIFCESCGVRVDRFSEAKVAYEAQKREADSLRLEELETTAVGKVQEQVHQGLKHIWRLVAILLVAAVALGAVAVLIAGYIGRQERQKREQLLALEQKAAWCLAANDFACAHASYRELLQSDLQNEAIQNHWLEACLGLAKQYAAAEEFNLAIQTLQPVREARPADLQLAMEEVNWRNLQAEQYRRQGNWQAAIETLTAALEIDKTNPELPLIIQDMYDEWIEYERASGNFAKALRLQMEKNVRFRPEKGK